MKDILFSANTILPVFIMVVLGWFLKKKGFLTEAFFNASDKFVFKISLPCMLFLETASAEISLAGNYLKLGIFCVCLTLAICVVLLIVVPMFIREDRERGAFIQGTYRSNFAILGAPIAAGVYGAMGTTIVAFLMPFVIPVYNVLAVTILSRYAPQEKKISGKALLFRTLKATLTNPLIISIAAALPFMIFSVKLPGFAEKSISYLSNTTFALSLMSLGACFTANSLKLKGKKATVAAVLKTIVLPTVSTFLGYICGFRGIELGIVFLLTASPTAVSSYIMAKNMHSDDDLAGQILLISTAMCFVTMFFGIYILKSFALI